MRTPGRPAGPPAAVEVAGLAAGRLLPVWGGVPAAPAPTVESRPTRRLRWLVLAATAVLLVGEGGGREPDATGAGQAGRRAVRRPAVLGGVRPHRRPELTPRWHHRPGVPRAAGLVYTAESTKRWESGHQVGYDGQGIEREAAVRVDTILTAVASLSPAERAELLDRLREQYGELPSMGELSDELKAELDLRALEADANPGSGSSWADVVADMDRRRRNRAALRDGLARLATALRNHREYGQYPFTPLSPARIVALRQQFLLQLGASLPLGYSQLLREVDGFVYNGLSVYAASPRPQIHLPGVIEENAGTRLDLPEYVDYLVFGHNDLDHLTYRISDGAYLAVGRGTSDVLEVHA